MARIELDHVTKLYPGGVPAVNDLSLDVPDGDFMVFVGPSGSGKSTAPRMIAGAGGRLLREDPHRRAGGQRPVAQGPRHRHGVPELRRGRAIDLAIDTSALYWFDPDSGRAIARQAAGDRPSNAQDAIRPAAVA
jgi:ATPase subunit of ABC transporter with duplicated ATPase domains